MPISRPVGLTAVLAALVAVVGCSDEDPSAAIVSEATDWPWQTSPPTPTSAPVVSETQAPTVTVTTEPTLTQEPVGSLTEPGGVPTGDPVAQEVATPPSASVPSSTDTAPVPSPSEASEQPRDGGESSPDFLDLIRIALTGSDG